MSRITHNRDRDVHNNINCERNYSDDSMECYSMMRGIICAPRESDLCSREYAAEISNYIAIRFQNALLNRNNRRAEETSSFVFFNYEQFSARRSPNCENQERRSGPHDSASSRCTAKRMKRLLGHKNAVSLKHSAARSRIRLVPEYDRLAQ